jgi:UPF0755 protein
VSGRRRARNQGGLSLARRFVTIAGGALAVLGVAFGLVLLWALWTYQGPGPAALHGKSTDVILRPGAGVGEIAATLSHEGVIRSASLFVTAAQATGSARLLKAGEYDFPSHASMASILAKIREGKVVRRFVTVPEGVTSEMVVDILMKADYLSGAAPVPPEGTVLPETYEVRRGEDRAVVLQRMMDARDKLLGTLWDRRRPDLPFRSPDQAVTLASIVEKETAKADERPRIAAVFVNRLEKGMRLESDPTIIYGLTRGRPLGHGIRLSEVNSPTPYNTYLIAGLPPTPIGNPGRASLAATLDPPKTTELYFVADGTGGHVFASTFDEHVRNVAKWRAVEQAAKTAAAGK